MKVTAKVVARHQDESSLRGVATVCLNNEFLITGVRIVACEQGLAVFMPSRRVKLEEYKDICFPITAKLHQQIKETVLTAYQETEEKS